jgi:hypothetical protein
VTTRSEALRSSHAVRFIDARHTHIERAHFDDAPTIAVANSRSRA